MENTSAPNPDLKLTTAPSNSSPRVWQYARERGDRVALKAEQRKQLLRLRILQKRAERNGFHSTIGISPSARFSKYMLRLIEHRDVDPRTFAARVALRTKLWQRLIDPRPTRNKSLL